MGEKKRRSYVLMPPGHPIILFKSNLFNMAAVICKKVYSIHLFLRRSIGKSNYKDIFDHYLGLVIFKMRQGFEKAWEVTESRDPDRLFLGSITINC